MTGHAAIDIFIGLVFIYLLYSLLATLLAEIIATNLGYRARNLKLMIVRMLSDEKFTFGTTFKTFWSKKVRAKEDSLAVRFYNSPQVKYLSSGNFFSKPSAISSQMFVSVLISILGKGNKSIIENIHNYFSEENGNKGDTYQLLKFYYEESNKDLDKFKQCLENWYNEMTERSRGWYKKRIQSVLFVISLIITTAFNVDTFQITRKLSNDPKAREYFVQAASQIDFKSDSGKSIAFNNQTEEFKRKALDSLFHQSFEVQEIISLNRCSSTAEEICACDSCSFWEKYWYNNFSNFLGCLLSALALSMGAPFWYDLLNKLMQLRGSVSAKKTEEEANTKSTEPKTIKG